MGVCDSKGAAPISKHVSQQSIETLSHHRNISNISNTSIKSATQHNHLISRAVNIIDAANTKIKKYQLQNKEYETKNEELQTKLDALKSKQKETNQRAKQYKEQLDTQASTMIKWKERIEILGTEIENMTSERNEFDLNLQNKCVTISDSLYKIHGDNMNKLKYNKESQKMVLFTNKINHLFYYDSNGPKHIIVTDISTENDLISKQMNKQWFLVIGNKRSVLFATDDKQIYNKWVTFIRESLTNSDTNPNTNESSNSNSTVQMIEENQSDDQKQFGLCQSPINLKTNGVNSAKCMEITEFESNPLKFNYPSEINGCTVLNNGHTVQININNNKCQLHMNNSKYYLKQFHFHTPSEHTIDNKLYDMEMHLVHINDKNEIAVLGFIFTTKQKYKRPKLELTKSRAHLILSNDEYTINCNDESDDLETDDEWDDENDYKSKEKVNENANNLSINYRIKNKNKNDFLSQFWNELPMKKTESDIKLSKAISFDYLFETSSNNFTKNILTNEIDIDMEIFEYNGSLTTPPFTEGVQWLVSKETHFINEKQLKKLSACWGNENNARDVQDYCGRTVSIRSKSSLRVV